MDPRPDLEPSQQQLRERYDYHPDGYLTLRYKRGPRSEGERVGSLHKHGYYQTHWNKRAIKIHRLIYIWHHGEITGIIDHIDRDKLNNKIENLRDVDKATNCQNNWRTVKNGFFSDNWYYAHNLPCPPEVRAHKNAKAKKVKRIRKRVELTQEQKDRNRRLRAIRRRDQHANETQEERDERNRKRREARARKKRIDRQRRT